MSGGYLLDTHVWFWYVTASERLPEGLRRLITSELDACRYSPVSVWELGLSAERGRLTLDSPLRPWVRDALEASPLGEAPLTTEVVLRASETGLPHRDPADRFLAATALTHDLTLLTVDQRLTRARGIPTRSR